MRTFNCLSISVIIISTEGVIAAHLLTNKRRRTVRTEEDEEEEVEEEGAVVAKSADVCVFVSFPHTNIPTLCSEENIRMKVKEREGRREKHTEGELLGQIFTCVG